MHMRVIVLDRQFLQMREQVHADLAQRAGRNRHHDARIEKARQRTGEVHRRHDADHAEQTGKIRVLLPHERCDIVIDERF